MVPAVRGGEHRGAADHVLEHAAHGELRARRRAVEVGGRDAGDDARELRGEQVELGERVHGTSVRRGAVASGGFVVAAERRPRPSASALTSFGAPGMATDRAPRAPRAGIGCAPHSAGRLEPAPCGKRPIRAPSPAAGWCVRPMPTSPAQPMIGRHPNQEVEMHANADQLTVEMELGEIGPAARSGAR